MNHCLTMSWLARRAYIREPLINQELHSERSEKVSPFQADVEFKIKKISYDKKIQLICIERFDTLFFKKINGRLRHF